MDLKAMAKKAANMKVHQMPEPPKPKKTKGMEVMPYNPVDGMKEKPRIRLNSVQMPGIKDMKPGHKCVMMCEVEMTGYNQEQYMGGEAEATFEIQAIAMPHNKA